MGDKIENIKGEVGGQKAGVENILQVLDQISREQQQIRIHLFDQSLKLERIEN